MKQTIAILAAIVICTLYVRTACGATYKWTYQLGTGSVMHDMVPDGKGGALLCYSIGTSNAVYVTYLGKNGGPPVWHKTFAGFTIVRAKFLVGKKAVITLFPTSGETQVREIDMKTGVDVVVGADSGWSYTVDPTTTTGNKDMKGFFMFEKSLSTGVAYILRYSYK